jgi:hypothetical protein
MRKFGLLFITACFLAQAVQPLDLKKVNEWEHNNEYWDPGNKVLGIKRIIYRCTLANDQVLCEEFRAYHEEHRYYIKNYLTGETTYRFKDGTRLSTLYDQSVYDQYGAYVFLEKDGGLVLFDVKEKREYIPGEPLKRGTEYIFYSSGKRDRRNPNEQLLKHNILTGKIEEVHLGSLSRDEYNLWFNERFPKLEYIGNSRLTLYGKYSVMILQLNEAMTEVENIAKRETEIMDGYIVPIDRGKYINFPQANPPGWGDEAQPYYVELCDDKGRTQKEYKDIILIDNGRGLSSTGIDALCLVSRDKRHVLFFNSYSASTRFFVYVYKIIYETFGVLNDSRVRIRKTPGLSGEILGVVNRGDKVEILESGTEKQKIDGLESVWFRIRTDANVEGWVFGAYVDITESN